MPKNQIIFGSSENSCGVCVHAHVLQLLLSQTLSGYQPYSQLNSALALINWYLRISVETTGYLVVLELILASFSLTMRSGKTGSGKFSKWTGSVPGMHGRVTEPQPYPATPPRPTTTRKGGDSSGSSNRNHPAGASPKTAQPNSPAPVDRSDTVASAPVSWRTTGGGEMAHQIPVPLEPQNATAAYAAAASGSQEYVQVNPSTDANASVETHHDYDQMQVDSVGAHPTAANASVGFSAAQYRQQNIHSYHQYY